MGNAVRIGMVGYGRIGRRQALGWRALALTGWEGIGPIELVALAAPILEAGEAREEAFFDFTTDDPEDVIDHPDVDIIHVCAPPSERAAVLRSALASGKHVLCAPPLTGDLRDAEEIAALAGRIPGSRQMVSKWRWLPETVRARDHIQGGYIGEPQVFRLSCRRGLASEGPRMGDERVAGGTLDGLLTHAIDLARALNGEVAEVNALVESMLDPRADLASTTQEFVAALVRFANGSVGVLEATGSSTDPGDSCVASVSGSAGGVSLSFGRTGTLVLNGEAWEAGGASGEGLPGVSLDGEIAGLRAFLRSIRENEPTAPTFRDGLMAQRVIAAISASAEEEEWQPVDLGR